MPKPATTVPKSNTTAKPVAPPASSALPSAAPKVIVAPASPKLDFDKRRIKLERNFRRSLLIRGVQLVDTASTSTDHDPDSDQHHTSTSTSTSTTTTTTKSRRIALNTKEHPSAKRALKRPADTSNLTLEPLLPLQTVVYPQISPMTYPTIAIPASSPDDAPHLSGLNRTIAVLHAQYLEYQQENIELRKQLSKVLHTRVCR
jgi:hypothetical protein